MNCDVLRHEGNFKGANANKVSGEMCVGESKFAVSPHQAAISRSGKLQISAVP